MNILITGASGLIGTRLTTLLLEKGHAVAHLGRKKSDEGVVRKFKWDVQNETIDAGALSWAEVIIHLAGANVAEGRWTEKRKKEIIDSRVKSVQLLAKAYKAELSKAKIFVSAAALGWYGIVTTDKIFTEQDAPANDFFGEVCLKWENAADLMEEIGLRTVKLRIGVVLAKEGGALPKLAGPVKWFVGSALGSGKQWMPWIHIDDVCAMFIKAIEDETMHGAYNAVASEHVTNKEFVKSIGNVLHRSVFLPPVPKFALNMVLGEMAGIVTEGSRASNEKVKKTGFVFKYNELKPALEDLL